MSDIIKDGGPAFPCEQLVTWQEDVQISDPQAAAFGELRTQLKSKTVRLPGMSLRAWLAGMAMQGILAHQSDLACRSAMSKVAKEKGVTPSSLIAMEAVELADALIAELNKNS